MRKILLTMLFGLLTGTIGVAQQTASDSPATKEDVQKYLEVMHSREMIGQMVDAMSKPMHQMIHEQFLKDKDKLPPDFEARMNKMIDEGEAMQAMTPLLRKQMDAMTEHVQQEIAQMKNNSKGAKSQATPN